MKNGFFDQNAIFILDSKSLDILEVNDCAIKKYGYSRAQFLEMNLNDLGVQKKNIKVSENNRNQAVLSDKIWLLKTKEGKEQQVQFTTQVFNYKGRRAKMAVAHDVTALLEDKKKNANKFPAIPARNGTHNLAEIIWSEDKQVLRWSKKAENLFGWRAEEVVRQAGFFERFIHKDEHEAAFKQIDKAFSRKWPSYQVNGRVVDKQGNVKVCEWNNTIEYDEAGNVVAVYSLAQDITERKRQALMFESITEKSLVGIYLIQ